MTVRRNCPDTMIDNFGDELKAKINRASPGLSTSDMRRANRYADAVQFHMVYLKQHIDGLIDDNSGLRNHIIESLNLLAGSSFSCGTIIGTSSSSRRFAFVHRGKQGGKRSGDIRKSLAEDGWKRTAQTIMVTIRNEMPTCTQARLYELTKDRWPRSEAKLPGERTVLTFLRKLERDGSVSPKKVRK